MAKKGKEIDIAGYRVQLDPLILATRVVARQKKLMVIVAVIGGILTAGAYVRTPKRYMADSNILIRYENYEEQYLQKLLNVAVGYLGSDMEMTLIINELDLYPKVRASQPYEMALRTIRTELKIENKPSNIKIAFLSQEPEDAQRVVAFTTERMLSKMGELNEAPFSRELDGIRLRLAQLKPKKDRADQDLYTFKNRYPEIASVVSEMLLPGSPVSDMTSEVRRAEKDLEAARAGHVTAPESRAVRNTPESRKLLELKAQLKAAEGKYTDTHPQVVAIKAEVRKQESIVNKENDELDGVVRETDPTKAKQARIARAEAHLQEVLRKQVDLQGRNIKKPKLQQQWAELSLKATTIASEYGQLLKEREKVVRDRILAANRYQENFQLIDPALLPQVPAEPNRTKFMGVGMAITALIGILAALVREALRQTFLDSQEFEEQTGLQVFAVLPPIKME